MNSAIIHAILHVIKLYNISDTSNANTANAREKGMKKNGET
jgi:hypothetical protein